MQGVMGDEGGTSSHKTFGKHCHGVCDVCVKRENVYMVASVFVFVIKVIVIVVMLSVVVMVIIITIVTFIFIFINVVFIVVLSGR